MWFRAKGGVQPKVTGRAALAACALLALCACTQRAERADIRIKGAEGSDVHFEIGRVRSRIATDAVDEAARMDPRKVYVHICLLRTPAERIAQLQAELKARLEVPASFVEAEDCPPIQGR